MQPASGGSAVGGRQGTSPCRWGFPKLQSPRASRRYSPRPPPTHSLLSQRRAGASRARSSRSLCAARAPEPPGGSAARGAGCGRSGASRRLLYPPEDRTPQAPDPAGPGCARESVCSPGPKAVGRRGFQSLGSGSCSRDQPRRTRPQVRPPTPPTVPAPGWGRRVAGEGRGLGTTHLCPPFLPAARAGLPVFSQPASRARGSGRSPCGVRGRGGPACSTPRLGRARHYPASRARRQARCAARRRLTKSCGGGLAGLAGAGGGGRTAPRPGQVSGSPGRSLGARASEGAEVRGADATAGVLPPGPSGAAGRLWGLGVRTGAPPEHAGLSPPLTHPRRGTPQRGRPRADKGRRAAGAARSGFTGLTRSPAQYPVPLGTGRQLASLGALRGSLPPGNLSPNFRPLPPFPF